ncbi:uncharacterized protein LOC142334457 [Lycorma delicatula]|uniref:uncharacterized protein LOC142334457 n=1 Tax=Lycorma delicatula TaxID=130591 RepID=UPI003F51382C
MCYQHLVQAVVNNDVNNVIKLLTYNENQIKCIITCFKAYYLFYKAKSNVMITVLINYFDSKRIIDISNILTSIIDCAIANGADIEIIRRLVKRNANINGFGVQSISLLHSIKSKRSLSFIKELLEMGVNVHEICAYSKHSVLHFAIINYCDEKKLELIKLLIDYGADVNFRNNLDEIPLIKALLLANEDLCIELIIRGSDINEHKELVGGNGVLTYAFTKKYRSIDLIQKLITNGANVNAVNIKGCTPLFLAIENNYSTDIIVKLIECGADVNKSCKYNSRLFSPLLLATELKRDKEILIALINHGANVNIISGGFRTTPLVSAIYHKYKVEVIDKLINVGADVNGCDGNGASPLIHAMNNDDKEIISKLINSGADVNKVNYSGISCLFYAVVQNNGPEIINLLIDKGINTNINIDNYWFSIKGVKIGGNNSVKLFHNKKNLSKKNYYGAPYLIHALYINMSKDIISDIIHIGANVNARDGEGRTPLIFSIGAGCELDVIIKLLECGADVNFRDSCGRTPLMHTHRSPHFKQIIKILIDRGADVNAYDENCNTLLMIVLQHIANAEVADIEVLNFLIAKGANVNACNISGKTPLMFAVDTFCSNNLEIVNVLIKHGANVTAVDIWGCNVLCYGSMINSFCCDDEIFHVLLTYGANVRHLCNCSKNIFQGEGHLTRAVIECRDVGTINELLH